MSAFGGKATIEITADTAGFQSAVSGVTSSMTFLTNSLQQYSTGAERAAASSDKAEQSFIKMGRSAVSSALGGAAAVGALIAAVDRAYKAVKQFQDSDAALVDTIEGIRDAFGDIGSWRLDELSKELRGIDDTAAKLNRELDKEIASRTAIQDLTEGASDQLRRDEIERARQNARRDAIEKAAAKAADEEAKKDKERAKEQEERDKEKAARSDEAARKALEDANRLDDFEKRRESERDQRVLRRRQIEGEFSGDSRDAEILAAQIARDEALRNAANDAERRSIRNLYDLELQLIERNARIKDERFQTQLRKELRALQQAQSARFGIGDIDLSNITAGQALQVIARNLPQLANRGGY